MVFFCVKKGNQVVILNDINEEVNRSFEKVSIYKTGRYD